MTIGTSCAVVGALSDPTRRALLETIAGHRETTATQLAAEPPISRQAVLKHLNALTDAGLLHRTRREVRYQFTPAPLSEAVGRMTQAAAGWDDRLAIHKRNSGPHPRLPNNPASAAESPDTAPPTQRTAETPAPPPSRSPARPESLISGTPRLRGRSTTSAPDALRYRVGGEIAAVDSGRSSAPEPPNISAILTFYPPRGRASSADGDQRFRHPA